MKIGIVQSRGAINGPLRIDPSYFLSEGIKVRSALKRSPYGLCTVGDCTSKVFYGNIFSRIWVKDAEHGVPYLAASDTVLSDLDTGNYIAKKQADQLYYLRLLKDWILITCSGTIGNVTYTHKRFEDYIATHDLIRVVPNDNNILRGVLFAFLASRYGYYQLTQSEYGGVVKHISDDYVESIDIPLFPEKLQDKVDALIKSAANLREQAAICKDKAFAILDGKLGTAPKKEMPVSQVVSSKKIYSALHKRMESSFYISENHDIEKLIMRKFQYKLLAEHCERIFKPNIFKRAYVENNGYALIGGADMMKARPGLNKQISRQQVNKIPDLKIERDWLLVSRAGTIGKTMCADGILSNCIVSEDVLRIVPKPSAKKGYLYAYLLHHFGAMNIKLYSYGSVIPHIEAEHLEHIPIPDLGDAEDEIEKIMQKHIASIELAKTKELEAISLIEKEIESWSK